MKKLLLFVFFVLIVQISFAQNNVLKVEQLFITNKVTGKSVKLFSNEEKLKEFGELLEVKNSDLQYDNNDYAKNYIFSNIVFYISTKGKISSFKTASPEIAIEKNGFFSISIGANISDLDKYFPEEVKQAYLINFGKENVKYLNVAVPLYDYHPSLKKDTKIDFAIWFLFNPQSKNLEIVYIWIRP